MIGKRIGKKEVLIEKIVQMSNALSLTNSTITDVSVSIPDSAVIFAPSGWDGIVNPPKKIVLSGVAPTGFAVSSQVIEVGSETETLIFDTPATVLLEDVVGTIGYKPSGSDSWIEITNTCGGTYDSPTLDSSLFPGECSISDGTNTKVLTFHFTSFGSLTPVSEESSTPSTLGGTGTCSTQWSCGSWGECDNSIQARVCSYPEGYCTPRSTKPTETQSCTDSTQQQTLDLESINSGRFGITGAVIGALGSGWTWLVVLIILGVAVVVVRRKNRS